eukprot:evm.model.scf_924.4 EVM.evm.TU.scf_924.4   scf_924:29233-33614(+)
MASRFMESLDSHPAHPSNLEFWSQWPQPPYLLRYRRRLSISSARCHSQGFLECRSRTAACEQRLSFPEPYGSQHASNTLQGIYPRLPIKCRRCAESFMQSMWPPIHGGWSSCKACARLERLFVAGHSPQRLQRSTVDCGKATCRKRRQRSAIPWLCGEAPGLFSPVHQPPEHLLSMAEQKEASVAAGEEKNEGVATAANGTELKKCKVALHLGYVGTGYNGLQWSDQPNVKTLEAELERALHDMGAISDSNFGDIYKVKWSRSSRTDKGVHSLGTVVAFKMLVDKSRFDSDPEGLEIAAEVNSKLTRQMAVLSVQRVNQGFRARIMCNRRCYRYHLPVSTLVQDGVEAGSEEEKQALEHFRQALKAMEGRRPFHNFTKRGMYRDGVRDAWKGAKKRKVASMGDSQVTDDCPGDAEGGMKRQVDEGSFSDIDDQEMEQFATMAGSCTENGQTAPGQQVLQKGKFTEGQQEVTDAQCRERKWRFWQFHFKEETADVDVIVSSHYRNIISFTASDPEVVVPGGVRAVQCEVRGQSFMLHQIRYMIATAVSVARGYISLRVLKASMMAPVRITLPLAPPHTLMLFESTFGDFPKDRRTGVANVAQWSGNSLQLRAGGTANRQSFNDKVLQPALNELLKLDDWKSWSASLDLFAYHEDLDDSVKAVLEKCDRWGDSMAKRKQERQELMAQNERDCPACE